MGEEQATWVPAAGVSQVRGPREPALIEETIGENLRRAAQRWGEREALVSCVQALRFTYAELDREVDRLAAALIAAGLEVGDRVGIWSPNCADWTVLQLATARVGVILVTVNPAYRSNELAYALNRSGCRVLVSAKRTRYADFASTVAEVRQELKTVERVVWLDDPSWEELLAGGADVPGAELAERERSLTAADAINIQFTSGTTGAPKGATLSHRNILNNGFFVGEGCGYTEEDRICVPVPFYHCFGMVGGTLAAISHGSCIVIPAGLFDPAATLTAVSAERCTSLYGVPTMFIAELELPEFGSYDLSSLRTGIMAGSPCPVEVMKRVIGEMNMSEVTICYGMTETSPVSTQTAADDPLEKRVGTVGRVHPHVEIKVADLETGEPVPIGQSGELRTRGYSVMHGYWEEPERTAEAIDADGWMHTGDLATMDADGYLNIVGRSKDLVIRGGENIYPREIEEFLHTHPEIADVQVVGVPDERRGEELLACVVPRPGSELSEEDVIDFCQGQIAHYKVPRYVKLVEGFPMTITGKVQKFKLREQAIQDLNLQSAADIRTA